MKIFVKIISGEKTITLDVKGTDTIGQVMKKIAEIETVGRHHWDLMYKDKYFNDKRPGE